MLFSAFLEIISIASVSPFIILIAEPKQFNNNKFLNTILTNLNLSENKQALIFFSSIFIFLIILSCFIRIINYKFALDIAAEIANDFGSDSYFRSLHQEYEIHLSRNSNELIANNLIEINRVEGAIFYALTFLTGAIISLAIIVTLFKFNFFMTLSSGLILGVGYLFMGNWSRVVLRKNSFIISQANKAQVKAIQEGLGSIRDILIEGWQKVYAEKYKEYDFLARKKLADKNLITIIPRYSFEALAITLMVFFALIYSLFSFNNSSFLPTLALFALASQKLLPAMQQCYSSLSNIRANHSAIVCLLEMLNQKVIIRANHQKIESYILKKQIVFNNIKFGYKNNKPIFNNLNFEIFQGETTGIFGETGSGKSTLIDLLLGLLKPLEGKIIIDDKKLDHFKNDYFSVSWQKSLAHVPQYIFLNDCSIRENIALGSPLNQINEKLMKESIEKAMLKEFISSLPNGLNTIVGERGFLLSGGQRQRIGLARAIYKNSKVLILDEATNALDQKTEEKILSNLCSIKPKITLIIITHNKNVLDFCDRIISLK